MKHLAYTLNWIGIFILLAGCTAEPKPIPYGEANCTHCSMTVSDNRYGAELVNSKGKAVYFDATECLAMYVSSQPELQKDAAFLIVTDFTEPGKLVEAQKATFLRSEALPSPMGMNLTALGDAEKGTQLQQEHGGELLSWEQVLTIVKQDVKHH